MPPPVPKLLILRINGYPGINNFQKVQALALQLCSREKVNSSHLNKTLTPLQLVVIYQQILGTKNKEETIKMHCGKCGNVDESLSKRAH